MTVALILDDCPNVVIDEEGFVLATFREEADATAFVKITPHCSIETDMQRTYRLRDERDPA